MDSRRFSEIICSVRQPSLSIDNLWFKYQSIAEEKGSIISGAASYATTRSLTIKGKF